MANPVRDLWPEDVTVTDVLPPVAIMRQQAALLGDKTQNLVQAEVTTKAAPKGQIRHSFTWWRRRSITTATDCST
jgi:hypothetical protein